MIVLNKVTKKYPNCIALSEISITVPDNQFLAITGKSGSGKSTLLSVMSGLIMPTNGTVQINGKELSQLTDSATAHLRNYDISFIFQDFHLVPEYTVIQNVALPLLFRKKESNIMQTCENQLKNVGIFEKRDEKAGNLSGGEQQRCAIARALVTNPSIIFADEPCGNLDSGNRKNIMSILQYLKSLGKTVVLVTHNEEEAVLADRIVELKDGTICRDNRRL